MNIAATLFWLMVFFTSAFSSFIAESRAIDWSKAGVEGGIPNRTTIFATLNPGATAAQINTAIVNCPENRKHP